MPRCRRLSVGGLCYHAINRANPDIKVFDRTRDCERFMELIAQANQRLPMRILAWCFMPNHFHFVLWPRGEGDMSRWMHWLLTSHVLGHHKRNGTYGRIWQGRSKAFPIQQDRHLLKVMRYVERNPLRSGLVERAEDWPWSSLWRHANGTRPDFSEEGPVDRFDGWIRQVNEPQTDAEVEAIRTCVQRERPFGDLVWTNRTARELGLEFTLRGVGRPRER